MYTFGAGILYGYALTDATGATLSVPTPYQFGTLQNVNFDASWDTKQLYGSRQFPVAIGRGKGKITCKADIATINGGLLNSLVFGQTLAAGIDAVYTDSTGTAVPTTPYQITPTIPSSGTWAEDLGVISVATGLALTKVASGPTTGQYSVSAGVYTFAAADTTLVMFINFRYTATSTTAAKMTIANLPMGYAPTFKAVLSTPYNGKNLELIMPNCVSDKLSFATKLDDFAIPSMNWSLLADASNNVAYWNLTDK